MPRRRTMCGLPAWRLNRVAAYVSTHLAETVTLVDMATVAGLSRMHFAAQFRVTTGIPPHEFLLRQRIEKAQELMLETRSPLVAIALDVGFETQAHFTTVFKRITGDTPSRWRKRALAAGQAGRRLPATRARAAVTASHAAF